MRKSWCIALALVSAGACGQSISVKDNSNVELLLSENNYNRIVVKNDKIMEAVFPPNAMAIKRDEQDGSVYVILSSTNPFTLFLTTEAGRHFSVTLKGEPSLGKTIELAPQQPVVAKAPSNNLMKSQAKAEAQAVVPEAILAMLEAMEHQKPFTDVKVSRQFGKAERWARGLTLLPQETWNSSLLKGDIIELYNGGKERLELSQEWFVKDDTLAVKFSKPAINPGERAKMYRVQGVGHG
ncbi:TPA: type-F conjugative transfer system secretin TraK [Legionella pneumophila]|nr:type-F conjugative transfer system secretin TraK [Legionella pneumophila]HCU5995188.1 type-F conjugative transfer system secretin TraK [Legionella pneumophila]